MLPEEGFGVAAAATGLNSAWWSNGSGWWHGQARWHLNAWLFLSARRWGDAHGLSEPQVLWGDAAPVTLREALAGVQSWRGAEGQVLRAGGWRSTVVSASTPYGTGRVGQTAGPGTRLGFGEICG